MASGSIKVDYLAFGRMWIISLLQGGNLDGERGRGVKSGVLPDGTLASQLVYSNSTASL